MLINITAKEILNNFSVTLVSNSFIFLNYYHETELAIFLTPNSAGNLSAARIDPLQLIVSSRY